VEVIIYEGPTIEELRAEIGSLGDQKTGVRSEVAQQDGMHKIPGSTELIIPSILVV
jgi:hypothetical protein